MAPLTDEDRLLAFTNAISNWKYTGYIDFRLNETAHKWLRANLPNLTLGGLREKLSEYVTSGGEIDEVRETRPEWREDYEYHYDLRFTISGCPIYVETRLIYRPPFKPDQPSIRVVNIHAP